MYEKYWRNLSERTDKEIYIALGKAIRELIWKNEAPPDIEYSPAQTASDILVNLYQSAPESSRSHFLAAFDDMIETFNETREPLKRLLPFLDFMARTGHCGAAFGMLFRWAKGRSFIDRKTFRGIQVSDGIATFDLHLQLLTTLISIAPRFEIADILDRDIDSEEYLLPCFYGLAEIAPERCVPHIVKLVNLCLSTIPTPFEYIDALRQWFRNMDPRSFLKTIFDLELGFNDEQSVFFNRIRTEMECNIIVGSPRDYDRPFKTVLTFENQTHIMIIKPADKVTLCGLSKYRQREAQRDIEDASIFKRVEEDFNELYSQAA